MIKTTEHVVQTKGHCDIHDLTPALRRALGTSGLKEGQALVFVGGSTAGVTTIEFEPGLVRDIHEFFEQLVQNPPVIGYWLECGGDATVRSYDGRLSNIPVEHLAFIHRCKRYYEIRSHFFVHANYAADVSLDEQPDYLLFWEHLHLHVPAPHENGKRAVVGHTSQKSGEILDLGHVVCLDTYCHGGGWLTAMEMESGRVWQADRQGRLRSQ